MKVLRFFALGSIIISISACAIPSAVPGGLYFAENNTARHIRCNFGKTTQGWEGWLTLAPGEELVRKGSGRFGRAFLVCAGQKSPMQYRLKQGKRYSILPLPGGGLQIRLVEPKV